MRFLLIFRRKWDFCLFQSLNQQEGNSIKIGYFIVTYFFTTYYQSFRLEYLMYSIVWNKRLLILYFFPGPTALLRALRLLNFGNFSMAYRYIQVWWAFCNITLHIFFMPYVYSRPHVYSFWQIFHALRLLHALRLFQTLEYLIKVCVVLI